MKKNGRLTAHFLFSSKRRYSSDSGDESELFLAFFASESEDRLFSIFLVTSTVHDINPTSGIRNDSRHQDDQSAANQAGISEEDGEAQQGSAEHVVVEGEDG